MKKTNCYILSLLMAAALTACSSDVDQGQQSPFTDLSPDGAVPVTFSVSDLRDITRAASSIVTFNANEKVKVFVKPNGASDYTQYDYKTAAGQSNVSLTLEKNYATNDATPPYFPAGTGTTVQAYAYYPATAASAATFSVADNQTTDDNYKASDLMYAEVRTITKGSDAGTNLQMSHLMAQLHLNVTGVGLTVNRVLVNAKRSVTFTPSDGTATATGTASDIVAATAAGDAYVCIPVQPINTVTIKVETGSAGDNATTATFTFTSTDDFEAGKSYPINLTVNATSLGTTTAISDWNGQQSVTYAPTGDLTIAPISEVTYNGSAYTPTLVVKKGDTTLTKDAANGYTCQWFNNTNAGTAVVLVLGQGTYAGSVAVGKFTIQKADITPAVTMANWTYGNSASTPSVSGNSGSATVTYQYKVSTEADNTYTSTKPSDAGTYTVKAIIPKTSNYNGATATANFTISKAACSVALSATSLTINVGSTGTFTVSRSGDGNITATSSNTSIATVTSVNQNTGVVTVSKVATGEATITVTVAASDNYNAYTASDKKVTVSSDPGVAFDNVTSSHKGYYIAKNGKAYSTMDLANQYSTAVGYICYAGSVDKYFTKFIAIALNDAHTTYTTYSDAQSKVGTYASNNAVTVGSTTYNTNSGSSGSSCYDVVTNSTSTASNTRTGSAVKGWRIPTVTDWRYIFAGIGGPSATSPVGVGSGTAYGNGSTLRSSINTACGNSALQSGSYWSSSELSGDTDGAWGYSFNRSYFNYYNKTYNYYVRAVFAY